MARTFSFPRGVVPSVRLHGYTFSKLTGFCLSILPSLDNQRPEPGLGFLVSPVTAIGVWTPLFFLSGLSPSPFWSPLVFWLQGAANTPLLPACEARIIASLTSSLRVPPRQSFAAAPLQSLSSFPFDFPVATARRRS